MDVIALVGFLAPFLPALVKLGESAAIAAAEKFGEDAWDKAKTLWGKLRPRVEAKPLAQGAVQELAENSDDADAREALTKQLQKLLEADPALLAEVQKLMSENAQTVSKVISISQTVTGDKNIVIGQSDGSINIHQS